MLLNRQSLWCLAASLLGVGILNAVPSNDNFASRTSLGSVASFTTSGSNIDATLEASEPDFAGLSTSSVWYEWTAPSTGWVTLTTAGSPLDSVIGVFTGTAVSALTQIGFNDESADAVELGSDHFSRLHFHAISGTSYKISVSGWTDGSFVSQDSFTLALTAIAPAFSVSALSLTPDPVNITDAAASLALSLSAGTSVSGDLSMELRLQLDSDPARFIPLTLSDAHRISGTAASGTYQTSIALPRYLPDGNWRVLLLATDGARQTQWSHGGDATPDDFVFPLTCDASLSLINTGLADTAPPQLSAISAAPSSINAGNVSEGSRATTFTFSITDDLSGFDSGSITLVNGSLEITVASFDVSQRLSGTTALDGDYEIAAVIPYGIPAGAYALRVRLSDASFFTTTLSSESGSTFDPLPSGSSEVITITSTAGYPAWAYEQLFFSGQFDPTLDAEKDGAANLLEYAFNLSPSLHDALPITAGTGTAGLPLIALSSGQLRIEYIRRKAATNSGLTYTVQFSENLSAWSAATASPTVTSIDETWERVVITDNAASPARRFARVHLSYTQQ